MYIPIPATIKITHSFASLPPSSAIIIVAIFVAAS